MPRRNKKTVNKMRCQTCNGRIPTAYAKTHIDRCLRARNRRKSLRYTKYTNEGE